MNSLADKNKKIQKQKNRIENNLKILRKKKGDTQDQVAQAVGVSKRSYIYWENGDRQIKPDKAQALADYFNVEVGYLLGYSDDNILYFQSGEEFEKYRTSIINEYENSPIYGVKIEHGANNNKAFSIVVDYSSVPSIDTEINTNVENIYHTFNQISEDNRELLLINSLNLLSDIQVSELSKKAEFISELDTNEKIARSELLKHIPK